MRRRFELVGTANGVRVFDDYAHHPTEVRAALTALRTVAHQDRTGRPSAAGGRSIVVFQPHLYSRTQAFAREFAAALDIADEVFVLDVYAAREQPLHRDQWRHHRRARQRCPCATCRTSRRWPKQVRRGGRPGDVVVTMGAGDVTMLGPEIIAALSARAERAAGARDERRRARSGRIATAPPEVAPLDDRRR